MLKTVRELAAFTQTSPSWVYRMVEANALPYIRCGRSLRFDLEAVIAALREHDARPPGAAAVPAAGEERRLLQEERVAGVARSS
jgi:excisionase family DNA binding protein